MGAIKGITIKLPEATLRKLREEALKNGRSVAALIRERVEGPAGGGSVYAMTADLVGSVSGSRQSATNKRSRFRR